MARHRQPSGRTTSARACALSTVSKVLLRHKDIQACLNQELSARELSSEDAHLATRISYGYLRYKGRLDFILNSLCPKGLGRLPAKFVICLGLGGYELLFLDRVPAYATVNWVVNRVKMDFSRKLAGLANGVLRNVAREADSLNSFAYMAKDGPEPKIALSRWYSCPVWIVELLLESFGQSGCSHFLQKALESPPVGLRFHPDTGRELRAQLRTTPFFIQEGPTGMAFSKTPDPDIVTWERQGRLSRQSLAVQNILGELGFPGWSGPIWDACAGNGGKSSLMREYGTAQVWSSDRAAMKMTQCRNDMQRLHLTEPLLFVADATQPGPFRKPPGTIILDVPCSGFGVLSRRPDIKWKRKPKDVSAMVHIQKRMLLSACETLKTGGRLVYVTCTVTREENEHRIEDLLAERPHQLKLKRMIHPDPDSDLNESLFGAELERL